MTKYKCCILESQKYDQVINAIQLQELKGNLDIVCILSDDNRMMYMDGYPCFTTKTCEFKKIDYIIVSDYNHFLDVRTEFSRFNPNLVSKLISSIAFLLPCFDFKEYVKLIKNPPSIISNNCWGGIIYKKLGIKAITPFKNLWVPQQDFLKLMTNFKEYIDKPLICSREGSSDNFPIGRIGDVQIMFNHHKYFKDAKNEWDRRVKRLNYNNLIFVAICETESFAKAFDSIPVNKFGFSQKQYGCKYVYPLLDWDKRNVEFQNEFWRMDIDYALYKTGPVPYNLLSLLTGKRIFRCTYSKFKYEPDYNYLKICKSDYSYAFRLLELYRLSEQYDKYMYELEMLVKNNELNINMYFEFICSIGNLDALKNISDVLLKCDNKILMDSYLDIVLKNKVCWSNITHILERCAFLNKKNIVSVIYLKLINVPTSYWFEFIFKFTYDEYLYKNNIISCFVGYLKILNQNNNLDDVDNKYLEGYDGCDHDFLVEFVKAIPLSFEKYSFYVTLVCKCNTFVTGDSNILYRIGHMMFNSNCVLYDIEKGIQFYEACISHGCIHAINTLMDSLWALKDKKYDYDLFKLANKYSIEENNYAAMECLAKCYWIGRGTDVDLDKAVFWMKSATAGESYWAKAQLLNIYLSCEDKKYDYDLFKLANKYSIEENNYAAMECLAKCYWMGRGTDVDLDKAVFWMKKADEGGISWAKPQLLKIMELRQKNSKT